MAGHGRDAEEKDGGGESCLVKGFVLARHGSKSGDGESESARYNANLEETFSKHTHLIVPLALHRLNLVDLLSLPVVLLVSPEDD
jgi:hypothetical protein